MHVDKSMELDTHEKNLLEFLEMQVVSGSMSHERMIIDPIPTFSY